MNVFYKHFSEQRRNVKLYLQSQRSTWCQELHDYCCGSKYDRPPKWNNHIIKPGPHGGVLNSIFFAKSDVCLYSSRDNLAGIP